MLDLCWETFVDVVEGGKGKYQELRQFYDGWSFSLTFFFFSSTKQK
jgi:hypothetical protein